MLGGSDEIGQFTGDLGELTAVVISGIELITREYEAVLEPSIDAAIGFYYSLGNLLARLGERRAGFEAVVREALADADTAPVAVRLTDSALVGRRPTSVRSPSGSCHHAKLRERGGQEPRDAAL